MRNALNKIRWCLLGGFWGLAMHLSLAQPKTSYPKCTVKVLAVEPSPGVWSGYVEVDQWLSVLVTESTDGRFKRGQRYRIGVAVAPGPLFDKDSPKFSSSVVSMGKALQIKMTSSQCVHLSEKDGSIRVAAECIAPLP